MKNSVQRGFTLVELVVVTGIIIVISSIVLVNNNRFGGVILLENLAYNIALSIRQAQVYGISVQRFQSGNFSAGYGVHFSISSPDTYVLFADAITANGLYDCPQPGTSNCELVRSTTISSNYKLADLCVTPASSSEVCGLSSVDILFKRPEPDAWISSGGTSCTLNNAACAQAARIKIVSPRGNTMSVTIQANGQISVGN